MKGAAVFNVVLFVSVFAAFALSSESINFEITTVFGNLTFRALALRQREICPDKAKKSAFKPFRVVLRPLSTRFDNNKIFMFHSPTDAAAQFLF